ncbi:hypothetical protein YC2023_089684 [Brassica napus]
MQEKEEKKERCEENEKEELGRTLALIVAVYSRSTMHELYVFTKLFNRMIGKTSIMLMFYQSWLLCVPIIVRPLMDSEAHIKIISAINCLGDLVKFSLPWMNHCSLNSCYKYHWILTRTPVRMRLGKIQSPLDEPLLSEQLL